MISFEYDRSYAPPMPVARIRIRSLENPDKSVVLDAIIDSGADTTFIPVRTLQELGIRKPVREAFLYGIGGFSYSVNVYMIKIEIGPHEFFGTRVVGDEQNRAILGRNVINQLLLTLNGLANTLQISA
ncbi:MAG: hypothetical protein HF973_02705 [Chloroflexi bacterium]|nr:hypothetical protein [Chloroflexota bacterium]